MSSSPPPAEPIWALAPDDRHPWVEALLKSHWPHTAPPREIDPRDEMWRHTLDLVHDHRDRALVEYFRAGLTAAHTYLELLSRLSSPPPRPLRVLDFAGGWGRVTRFLRAARPDLRLTVSDVSRSALDFQRRHFGVATTPSTLRPEDLEIEQSAFDAVLVSSLFTHLPEETFRRWLKALWRLVAPGGVLAFSTHPEEAIPRGATLPPAGLYFEQASEIPELDTACYGRTWVTANYVEQALSDALDSGAPSATGPLHTRRFRRLLWHLQDLWVVAKPPEDGGSAALDLAALRLDAGADGRLDDGSFAHQEGNLWLGGWAAHPFEPGRPITVEIRVDGAVVAQGAPEGERPDVAERLGETTQQRQALRHCGFLLPLPLWPRPEARVEIRASDDTGPPLLLHLSSFEGLVAWLREKDLRQERAHLLRELQRADEYLRLDAYRIESLEAEKAAMEASRFWKMRNLWWRLRRS